MPVIPVHGGRAATRGSDRSPGSTPATAPTSRSRQRQTGQGPGSGGDVDPEPASLESSDDPRDLFGTDCEFRLPTGSTRKRKPLGFREMSSSAALAMRMDRLSFRPAYAAAAPQHPRRRLPHPNRAINRENGIRQFPPPAPSPKPRSRSKTAEKSTGADEGILRGVKGRIAGMGRPQ
jgi:hypothetical protein